MTDRLRTSDRIRATDRARMAGRVRDLVNGAQGAVLGGLQRFRSPGAGRYGPLIKKTVVTGALLVALYWGVTAVVAYITAPRLTMTMSPVVGPIAVWAEPARTGAIERKVTYTGSVAPVEEVTVYPRAEGWVTAFRLYEGDHVRKGDVIARLDRTELSAAAAEARAQIDQAEADLRVQEASLAEAEAQLAYQTAELGRDRVLVTDDAISRSDFDLRKFRYAAAQQRVAELEARIQLANAAVVRARETFQRRRTVLGYTDVDAPISGRVAKRYIYAGLLVRPGMPIVDLQDLSRVRVQAKVAEPDLPFVRPGTEAVVRFPALPPGQQERRARVTTVFPQLDPVSRTATVEVLLDNPGELIKPDMYAVVDLILERREKALVIPREAVLDGPDGKPIVYVTDAVTAMSRPVKLGIAEGERVEVVGGLKQGEMVVAKGQRNLSDGAQVQVVTGP